MQIFVQITLKEKRRIFLRLGVIQLAQHAKCWYHAFVISFFVPLFRKETAGSQSFYLQASSFSFPERWADFADFGGIPQQSGNAALHPFHN